MKKFTFLVALLTLAISASALDVYLIGQATPAGWDASQAVAMTEVETGTVYSYSGTFTTGEFKFTCQQGEWFPRIVSENNGTIVDNGGEYNVLYGETEGEGTPADYKFYIFEGTYTITLNLDATTHNGTMTVSGTKKPIEYPAGAPYICGQFNSWSAEEMDDEGDNLYSYNGVFTAGDNFKFRWADDWWPAIVADAFSDVAVVPGQYYKAIFLPAQYDARDFKFKFEEAGEHTIYLNLSTLQVYIDEEPTSAEESEADAAAAIQKVMIDGQIYIIAGDKTYNLLGAEVK